jgi:pyruvate dehydrogenase E1 component alpha subunit
VPTTLHEASASALVDAGLDGAALRTLYRDMVNARALDAQCVALQRQGFFPAIAPFIGHEAVQVGSVRALDRSLDFVFPTYRELAAACAWGVDPVEYLSQARGFTHGGSFNHAQERFGPVSSVVAGPVLAGVGWALGRQFDDAGAVALVFFGDGASSQGDVHEALNFAGVFSAPVIFLCVNNQWAISVPAAEQIAGGSIAARAAGYGMPGSVVDGNDVLAVWCAVRAAADVARAGGGPALIEARTYRYGPHSTSDDPRRYRVEIDDIEWEAMDPIRRFRDWLEREGVMSGEALAILDDDARSWALGVAAKVRAIPEPSADELFRFAYRNPPATVLAQQQAFDAEAGNA